ncbi:hypothetical protein [Brevibacillus sp. NRS-1366]|uniref:hypothetical protein n=1 Tax=Brevibacillus sp. NRS-1366 TaxID=3233899 RepID=UPI003D1F933E
MFKDISRLQTAYTFNEFNVKSDIPLLEQLPELKEDLFQITDKDEKYTIDIGWYPSMDSDGAFKIIVVKDKQWDCPVYMRETREL